MSIQVPKRRTRWQEKREASLEALLRSAIKCFHDRGYAATRVEDIVEGAGYSSGAFYFHFQNKADCYWQVLEYREQRRADWPVDILEGLDPKTTSIEEVLQRVFAHFAATDDGYGAWVLVMVDFFQQHRNDKDVDSSLADRYRRWHAGIAKFVAGLQAGGWIAAERDPEVVAAQLFAFTEGINVHSRLYGLDRRMLIDGLVRLLRD